MLNVGFILLWVLVLLLWSRDIHQSTPWVRPLWFIAPALVAVVAGGVLRETVAPGVVGQDLASPLGRGTSFLVAALLMAGCVVATRPRQSVSVDQAARAVGRQSGFWGMLVVGAATVVTVLLLAR